MFGTEIGLHSAVLLVAESGSTAYIEGTWYAGDSTARVRYDFARGKLSFDLNPSIEKAQIVASLRNAKGEPAELEERTVTEFGTLRHQAEMVFTVADAMVYDDADQ